MFGQNGLATEKWPEMIDQNGLVIDCPNQIDQTGLVREMMAKRDWLERIGQKKLAEKVWPTRIGQQ